MDFDAYKSLKQEMFVKKDVDALFSAITRIVSDIESFRVTIPQDATKLRSALDSVQFETQELYDDLLLLMSNASSQSRRMRAQQKSAEASSRGDILAGVELGVLATNEAAKTADVVVHRVMEFGKTIIADKALKLFRHSPPTLEKAVGKFVSALQGRADAVEKAAEGLRVIELTPRRRP